MGAFEIREDFYLNDQPFKILSGAIHYFRIDREDWYHSLYNLKALVSILLKPMFHGMLMSTKRPLHLKGIWIWSTLSK